MSSYLTPHQAPVHIHLAITLTHSLSCLTRLIASCSYICHHISVAQAGCSSWSHYFPGRSGLPPDLAQTLIPANQQTCQQCPEVSLSSEHPAASKSSYKQYVICLCLWIKCLCGGLSTNVGQCVFIRGLYMSDTQLNLPPTSHSESINQAHVSLPSDDQQFRLHDRISL